ncbi:glycerophosphodiester phosphodiesterase [Marinomonas sp. 15G1-11]|uniref:Glycerophosphodiester phosphodiesterase n=1 Tax=Marinomonas phaeophyticola TaxID=3004091 RepID=A0ABT4JXR2_9GAMM|nr:glycerophosphodiester phosphodiesterase [Marinomonas sp. 15G1-11]MCZ2722354.1 glycerophosphodiester phosphodiesterase [Marinomonas sp. 15G1-11]
MNMKELNKIALVGFLILTVSGCSSLSKNDNNSKKTTELTEEEKNISAALAVRNLKQDFDQSIAYDKGSCPVNVVAHRGSSRFTENSLPAVILAGMGQFDGVEIDVMMLRDGKWVIHHDRQTGRTVATSTSKRYRVSHMKSSEWNTLYLRSPNGELTSTHANYAWQVFQMWGRYSSPEKMLNIEVKSETDVQDLYKLNALAKHYIPSENFFFSSMSMDSLKKIRELNKDVYLGYVWAPDQKSINILKQDVDRGLSSDLYYQKNKDRIEDAYRIETRYRRRYKDSKLSAATVKKELGWNSGLHVDIRSFVKYPTIYSRANNLGLRVATYTINGSEYHQKELVNLFKQDRSLPDEAIMDNSKFQLCRQLNPDLVHIPNQSYTPSTSIGKLVSSLPNDADFDRLEDQKLYFSNHMYINYLGNIQSIKASNINPVTNKTAKATPVKFDIKDEEFYINTPPILISIPKGTSQ